MLLNRPQGFLLLAGALAAGLFVSRPVSAQAASEPKWKDGEFAVYEPITKENDAAKRLELLNTWKQKFPSTDVDGLRQQLYLETYSDLKRWPEMFGVAKEILDKDPNNLATLNKVVTSVYSVQTPTPDELAVVDKAGHQIVSNGDALFASDKKPAGVADADWANAKKPTMLVAQNSIGFAAWQGKDLERAQAEFSKSLDMDPTQARVSLWLWQVVSGQRKVETYSFALYEFARASAYDGPGSLPQADRDQNKAAFEKTYTQFHGSKQGVDELEAQVKSAALPPAGFKVLSKNEVARAAVEEENKKQEEFRKNNPMLALWVSIKTALTAADGATYFDNSMKGTPMPGGALGVNEFKGKLIEAKPALRPKVLVLSIEDGKTPDVTLKLDVALVGKMEPGAEIGFQGIPSAYTATPFSVTFDVEKAKITGWKGGPAPHAPVHHTATHKSAD